MPPRPWKTLSSRPIYSNPWISVREDIAETPNGHTTIYGVVSMHAAVGVLPFLHDDSVVLVRQYRYPHGENFRWEIPTGGAHNDESPLEAAQRELREEIGYEAASLEQLSVYHTSNSVTDETAWIFVARGLSPSPLPPDATEELEIGIFPFAQVVQWVQSNEIRDSLTVVAGLSEALRRSTIQEQSNNATQ